ncbi:MAG: tRNA (adenosine(37)-N6)-threonylcarbamoyltransferase complex dimerization subunit type 1 TsaB [Azoarcus sp.]|jgi:tRNA threonylcarbamoyladenosine biosynthesis protein TsaB|nr:tRNA (adenosine(37)-N6)-threonylcarbamoyltransferase complex dimerization subunit type 1 TsaB [Azoarcus sp.]
MRILAVESSCERASAALNLNGDIRLRRVDGHVNHSEHMLGLIRSLLAEAGMGAGALDAVAFGTGPGAFTGLRLACGIAQGLALGAGLGVIPICSLAALAAQSPLPWALVATDARMGEVYHGRYRVEGDRMTELSAPACCAPAALACPEEGEWFGLGMAFTAYGEALADVRARLAGCSPLAVPDAEAVSRLAAARGRAGMVSAEQAHPLYVRDKVALTVAERLAQGDKA